MVDGVGGVPREVARKLAAKSKMGGGKISASVWNEYAKTRGGNTVSNYINLSDAINSINHYNQMDEVKTVAKFTPPDLAKDDGIRPKEPQEDGVIDQNGLTPDQAKELKELTQFTRPNLAEDDGIRLKEPNEDGVIDQNGLTPDQAKEFKELAQFTRPNLAEDDGIRLKEPNEDGVIDQNGLTPDQAKELKELAQFKRPNLAEDDGIKLKEPNEEASGIAQNTQSFDGGTLAEVVVSGDKSKVKHPHLFAQIPKNGNEV